MQQGGDNVAPPHGLRPKPSRRQGNVPSPYHQQLSEGDVFNQSQCDEHGIYYTDPSTKRLLDEGRFGEITMEKVDGMANLNGIPRYGLLKSATGKMVSFMDFMKKKKGEHFRNGPMCHRCLISSAVFLILCQHQTVCEQCFQRFGCQGCRRPELDQNHMAYQDLFEPEDDYSHMEDSDLYCLSQSGIVVDSLSEVELILDGEAEKIPLTRLNNILKCNLGDFEQPIENHLLAATLVEWTHHLRSSNPCGHCGIGRRVCLKCCGHTDCCPNCLQNNCCPTCGRKLDATSYCPVVHGVRVPV